MFSRLTVQDRDLRPLRERREWLDAQDDFPGLVKSSARRSLRAEAKSPFRFARSVIFGALGASASIALLITLTRLIAILAGPGDKADLPVRQPTASRPQRVMHTKNNVMDMMFLCYSIPLDTWNFYAAGHGSELCN